MTQYAALAGVYEWLTPEPLLTPEGSAAAFAPWIDALPAGARVLDCAAGTGVLAAGLAARGFTVAASDASPEMVERIRALGFDARVRAWEQLPEDDFDGVLCVGNSLPHAQDRRAALAGMARSLRRGGRLVLTSRNWERERALGSRLDVDEQLTVRGGRRALLTRAWTIPEDWDAPHLLEVAVSILGDDGTVETASERLKLWPFSAETLEDDLRACGLEPDENTYAPDVERYLVTATRT